MKFEKGDKVVLLDMGYFSNQYHYKNCISELTVLDADEKYWSPYYESYDKYHSGMNQWSIIRQSDGTPMYGNKKFYHKTKDAGEIRGIIQAELDRYDVSCIDNDEKRIAQLEDKILACQEEIGMIRAGHGRWKSGFTTYGNAEYKEKVLKEIEKIFKLK
jgi:hypothetical protein